MEYSVTMPYLGGILSENAYKFRTRGTKPFVRLWMRELAEKVKLLEIPKAERYEVEVFGKFTDERRPDLSNLHKVIGDALQEGLGVNDKYFFFKDRGYVLGFFDPELVITIVPQKESILEVFQGGLEDRLLSDDRLGRLGLKRVVGEEEKE